MRDMIPSEKEITRLTDHLGSVDLGRLRARLTKEANLAVLMLDPESAEIDHDHHLRLCGGKSDWHLGKVLNATLALSAAEEAIHVALSDLNEIQTRTGRDPDAEYCLEGPCENKLSTRHSRNCRCDACAQYLQRHKHELADPGAPIPMSYFQNRLRIMEAKQARAADEKEPEKVP
jgi:hypothetical protein